MTEQLLFPPPNSDGRSPFSPTAARKTQGSVHPPHAPPPPTTVAAPLAVATRRRRLLGAVARQEWLPGAVCLCLDVLAWLVIYGTAVEVRGDADHGERLPVMSIDLLGLGAILLTLFVIGGYDRRSDHRSLGYTSEHVLAVAAASAMASFLIYVVASFGHSFHPSRGALLVSFALFVPVSLSYRRFISRVVAVNTSKKSFLVFGAGEIARRFYESYRESTNRQRLRFVDVGVGVGRGGGGVVGRPIAGPGSPTVEADPAAQLARLGPESSGVILAEQPGALSSALREGLVRLHFQRVPVYTLESFYETHWRRVPAHALDPLWPLQMGFQLARNSPYSQVKRVFDVAFSAAALCVLSPLLVLLVILTWLDSGRPALFRQTRVGRDGRPFTILKVRTMHTRPSVPDDGGHAAPLATATAATDDDLYTRPGDRRVTRLGRWLRKLRLDELPQLWNVFRGDMSLIGPRAEWDRCAERYERSVPSYHFRHLVKPGITGWAQVNYPYGESDADAFQKLKYDLYYIRHYSLKLDAMIILKTMHIMLFGKGQ